MIITINEDVCKKNGLETDELLALLLVKTGTDIPVLFKKLEEKKILTKDIFGRYLIYHRWDDVANTIILDSDKEAQKPERLERLALKLAEIFPKEKKLGTPYYFRGNRKDNILKLKKFFKIYGKYSDEEILDAARRYVSSFNGNYEYMRILKYFIWKDEIKTNSDGENYVEETSDLATWIENKGQKNTSSSDWTVSLN